MTTSLPTTVHIRDMRPADARAVAALADLASSTRRTVDEQWLTPERFGQVVVADDGQIVGAALWWSAPDEHHLLDLAIAPTHRRRGLATSLVERGRDVAAALPSSEPAP